MNPTRRQALKSIAVVTAAATFAVPALVTAPKQLTTAADLETLRPGDRVLVRDKPTDKPDPHRYAGEHVMVINGQQRVLEDVWHDSEGKLHHKWVVEPVGYIVSTTRVAGAKCLFDAKDKFALGGGGHWLNETMLRTSDVFLLA